ncbi:hypothetical protein CMK11_06425, partial [Candidatus Poribacteria bacterium]|nr:hypothetical protein [Candidatus Poribacteria bacterium]
MHAPVRGSLFLALLACLLAPGFTASAEYVPTPILEVGKPRLEDIAYSPDGRVLATLTTDWIELLDADTFEPVARFGRGGDEIEFSSDASEIAVFDGAGPARIYDADTGAVKVEIPIGRFAHAFSPDWRRLAYSDGDTVYVSAVRVWGSQAITMFASKDLENWESWTALDVPGFTFYNTSICKADDRYVISLEFLKPMEQSGGDW